MTLAGGRPDEIHLSEFLDAGYALLVEAYQSAPGGHLIDAIEKASEYAAGTDEEQEEMRERSVESDNDRSLAQLYMMMRSTR